MNWILLTDAKYIKNGGRHGSKFHTFHGGDNQSFFRFHIYRPVHDEKITVWCGVSASRIIGPYFFQDPGGQSVTINGDRYRTMLIRFLMPKVRQYGMEDHWFQQDGATAHTASRSINLLNRYFPNRLISKKGDFDWLDHRI